MVNFELGKEIEKDVFHLVVSRAWDKENNLSPHGLTLLILVLCRTCALLTMESLWLSGRAWESGIWRSEGQFLMEFSHFSTLVTRGWNLYQNSTYMREQERIKSMTGLQQSQRADPGLQCPNSWHTCNKKKKEKGFAVKKFSNFRAVCLLLSLGH